jgi:hypothetical protein
MHINIYSTFVESDYSTSLATWAGMTTLGVAALNGLALGNLDAVETELTTMDECLTHATPTTFT